jgi:hypothetical protein
MPDHVGPAQASGRGGLLVPFVAAAVAAAVFFAWQARMMFLDDAFIHLRIADNLRDAGIFSFNGLGPSYCTSSPLYTALLAALSRLDDGPFLPKIVGLVIYFALIALLAHSALRSRHLRSRWLWALFLAAVASPLGVRWLSDGMETGLAGLAVTMLARLALAIESGTAPRAWAGILAVFVTGLLLALLRVEDCLLVAMIGLASVAGRRSLVPDRHAAALAAGAAAGLATLLAIFGTVLPDTAVAKAVTTPLGLHAILDNLFGYRYFVFVEFFLLAYNIGRLDQAPLRFAPPDARRQRRLRLAAPLALVVLAAWQFLDYQRLAKMIEGRSASMAKFLALDLSALRGSEGIAWDIGMIGYFSQATILDVHGLVNGRAYAGMTDEARLRRFAADPKLRFAFGDQEQLDGLNALTDTRSWKLLESFDFPNFNGLPGRHYLLVRPD